MCTLVILLILFLKENKNLIKEYWLICRDCRRTGIQEGFWYPTNSRQPYTTGASSLLGTVGLSSLGHSKCEPLLPVLVPCFWPGCRSPHICQHPSILGWITTAWWASFHSWTAGCFHLLLVLFFSPFPSNTQLVTPGLLSLYTHVFLLDPLALNENGLRNLLVGAPVVSCRRRKWGITKYWLWFSNKASQYAFFQNLGINPLKFKL